MAKEHKIIDAKIYNSFGGTGIVVLTSSLHFVLVNNVLDPKLRRVADMPGNIIVGWFLHITNKIFTGLNTAPSSWCVLSDDRKTRLLVAQGKNLMILGEMENSAQPIVLRHFHTLKQYFNCF